VSVKQLWTHWYGVHEGIEQECEAMGVGHQG
jgi:hypothetical protein